ncbi:MAG TPA: LPS export ABC transporter ATP-binding protein [Chromatiaceae bacterium]|jgi:lipopolysaccharide export system ATP-binding protein|nr:LPS export ABC transporter ATP-binding protein [Chromatiaceae bacterium]HIN83021.1 LPS export ABC transporter ATP-binding protein [Chromatiales bacterium]HIO54355.1 LPS export ABC transporter ATP-binding protein [Chromatiales bacterium]
MSELSAEHLVKSYADRRVVNEVSVSVRSGEVVGLLGPNGAGKTTCFYMIVGLVNADAGAIFLDEMDITGHPMHVRARLGVGYLPQEPSIFRKLTVEDNLRAIIELNKDANDDEQQETLDGLLHDFHIGHLRDSLALSLSGGERRRLEIARALAANPQFILLDEPFAGVDPISVIDIQRIVKALTERGIGVLITDHNVRETLGSCDRAYIISEGQVIAEGNAETILADRQVRDVYLGHDFKM